MNEMTRRDDYQPELRAELIRWWEDLIAERCTRCEAHDWALEQLERGTHEEELVLQGILYLEAVDLAPSDRPEDEGIVHADWPDAPFYVSKEDISVALQGCQAELARYDADPDAWMRRYFQRMIGDFASRYDTAEAWEFAERLVADGRLSDEDASRVLGPRPSAEA